MEGHIHGVVVGSAPSTGEIGGGGEGKGETSPSPTSSPASFPPPPASTGVAIPAVGGGMGPLPPPPGMNMMMSFGQNNNVMVMGSADELAKKRERPTKYGAEDFGGGMALALSPLSVDGSGRRSRGRPRGSGRRQLLATLGEWFALSAGGNFTPHVITIGAGEDVSARIMSFSQKGPRAVCILSANGAISNVTLRQPGSSGGTLTYEGRFEILSLSGSFSITDDGGVRSRTGGISVSLAGPDGRVVGGGVAGLLLAASPIQVVVGSFLPNTLKEYKKKAANPEPYQMPVKSGGNFLTAVKPISQADPTDEECETPTSAVLAQRALRETTSINMNDNLKTNSTSIKGAPPFLRARDESWLHRGASMEQKASPDINISLPGE